MTWVKVDEDMPWHPKVMAAGAEAFAIDIAGLCYSNKFGTDGFVPDAALGLLFPESDAEALASKLVEAGRWVRDNDRGGFLIHDAADYQPTAAEATMLREKRIAAGRKGGQASGASRRQASASAKTKQSVEANSNPVPEPLYGSHQARYSREASTAPVDDRSLPSFAFGTGALDKPEPEPPSGPVLDAAANAERARLLRSRPKPETGS